MISAEEKDDAPSEEPNRIRRLLTLSESRPGALGEILRAERLRDLSPETVTDCLLDPVEATRILAVEVLYGMGERGMAGLVKALTPSQPTAVRTSGAMALGRLGADGATAAEPLAACVQVEDAVLRLHAGLALGRIGPEAIPHLLPLLQSPDEETARTAATALGRMGEQAKGALDDLRAVAGQSPSPYARIACLQAITSISGDPGLGILETIPLLESEDPWVRCAGLDAVRESGTTEGAIREKVCARLQDPVGMVRGAAALTLARVEPDAKEAVPLLVTLLSDGDLDVRAHTVMALAHYGSEASEAIEPLEALRGVDAPHLQAVVEAALARIRGGGAEQN